MIDRMIIAALCGVVLWALLIPAVNMLIVKPWYKQLVKCKHQFGVWSISYDGIQGDKQRYQSSQCKLCKILYERALNDAI